VTVRRPVLGCLSVTARSSDNAGGRVNAGGRMNPGGGVTARRTAGHVPLPVTARRTVSAGRTVSVRRSVGARCTDGDVGSGTVLVLTAASGLLLVGMLLASLAAVGVARHRAASVADLSALAAAASAPLGSDAACEAARDVAERSAARLLECRLVGDVAEVVASVRPPGRLGELGSATARARAGPAETGPALDVGQSAGPAAAPRHPPGERGAVRLGLRRLRHAARHTVSTMTLHRLNSTEAVLVRRAAPGPDDPVGARGTDGVVQQGQGSRPDRRTRCSSSAPGRHP
jgi:secretion/DNA translocation related TadE-like protein